MLGFTFFSASMWAGATLGNGLRASDFLLAVFAGNLILGLYTGALAYIAGKTGLSTHLLAKRAFGNRGAILPSMLLGVTQIGWFGVGVAMFVSFAEKIIPGCPQWIFIWGAGICMTMTAYYGVRSLTILSIIAVPCIAILGSVSMGKAFHDFGGLSAWFAKLPGEPITLPVAIGICVASFISGGTATPDFTRYARSAKSAVTATVIAFLLGNSLMFIFGAVAAAFYQTNDISVALQMQGFVFIALLVLGLNIWTTNDNAIYTASLGFSTLTKIPKRYFVLVNGFFGTLFAMVLYNNFVPWLNLLNLMLPSIGAILILDYFVVHRRGGNCRELALSARPIHWEAVTAWAAGFVAAKWAPGLAPLNALLASSVVYVLLAGILARLKTQPV